MTKIKHNHSITKTKLLIFLSCFETKSGPNDPKDQTHDLHSIYSDNQPDPSFFQENSLYKIKSQLTKRISQTDGAVKACFEQTKEELVNLLTLINEIYLDTKHTSYLDSCPVSQNKTLATIKENLILLTYDGKNTLYLDPKTQKYAYYKDNRNISQSQKLSRPTEFYISQDLSLLQETKLPNDVLEQKPTLQKFFEQLK